MVSFEESGKSFTARRGESSVLGKGREASGRRIVVIEMAMGRCEEVKRVAFSSGGYGRKKKKKIRAEANEEK